MDKVGDGIERPAPPSSVPQTLTHELLIPGPRFADQHSSTVGLPYHISTLLLSSILFLTLAGSAFSALRKS